MDILTIPLTDTTFITLFNAYNIHQNFSISKSSGYVLFNVNSIETDFSNKGIFFKNHTVIRVNSITEEKAIKIFIEAGIDGITTPYINYSNRDVEGISALESFNSFLHENWNKDLNLTWVIIPKPNKKLSGTKIPMEFFVGKPDFTPSGGLALQDLDVYMTPITRTSKSIIFSVRIPSFIYNKCMTNPIIEERPKRNYIESSTLADLHTQMERLVGEAYHLEENERNAKNSQKVLCIYFNSKEETTRDRYNHAYTGQRISTNFSFFVAYNIKNGSGGSGRNYFTYKKYQTGQGSTERGISGIIDTESKGQRNYLGDAPSVVIKWTQQREDFLIQLEERFRRLSVNLNSFLSELDEDKMQSLIENSNLLLIGN